MKEKLLIVAVVVFLLLVLFVVLPAIQQGDEQYIRDWGATHQRQIVKVERCYFSMGPFWWKNKNDRIYRVETEGKTVWFRFRPMWSPSIEEE